uniref:Reverse transcriptase domain-containing protein n=1 Tax=Tanacetum cinerariifolium TaxID=118510 RepID=A0A699K6Z8_TANCI|nr:reverse transcriptase domain-containing protein [Tanacetum cinerariifolium]
MMKEAQGPALERRITHPWIQASKPEEATTKEKEDIQEQSNKHEETTKSGQPLSFCPGKEVIRDKKDKEKDELPKVPNEKKPLEKVVIHNGHPDQTVTIRGNLTTECRTGLIKILHKYADAFGLTPTDMTGIPRLIAEHEIKHTLT